MKTIRLLVCPRWACRVILVASGYFLLPSLSAATKCEEFVEFDDQQGESRLVLGEEDAIEHIIACDRESILAMSEALRDQGHRVRISKMVLTAGLADGEAVDAPPRVEVFEHPHDSPDHSETTGSGENPTSEPVSEWVAWWLFYTGLRDWELEKPTIFQSFLGEKVGLTAGEARLVRVEGLHYVEQLKRLDEELRRGMAQRFPPEFTVSATLEETLKRDLGIEVSDILPYRTADGRHIHDVLASEGFFERDEASRERVLRTHWESLAELIGLYKLLRLEEHIKEKVQPRIHRGTQTRPVSVRRYPPPHDITEKE